MDVRLLYTGLFFANARRIVVCRPDLYFANSDVFRDSVLEKAEKNRVVVVDASIITAIDTQGLHTLCRTIRDMQERHVALLFAQVRHDVFQTLVRARAVEQLGYVWLTNETPTD